MDIIISTRETSFPSGWHRVGQQSHGGKVIHLHIKESDGTTLQILSGHTEAVLCVAVTGEAIASGGKDKTIRLWDATTGECLSTLTGSEDQVNGLALHTNGQLLSGEGSAVCEHTGAVYTLSGQSVRKSEGA